MEVSLSYLCSAGYLLMAVKVAISIFVNQLNATNLKSSETQFQFQVELSLAQLSPSLLIRSFSFYFTIPHRGTRTLSLCKIPLLFLFETVPYIRWIQNNCKNKDAFSQIVTIIATTIHSIIMENQVKSCPEKNISFQVQNIFNGLNHPQTIHKQVSEKATDINSSSHVTVLRVLFSSSCWLKGGVGGDL